MKSGLTSLEAQKRALEEINFFDVLSTGSEDNKRHFEMLAHGVELIESIDTGTILTIGDRYCRDGAYLKKRLGCRVVASDLDLSRMIEAKKRGYVDDVLNVNAEKISLPDESFDVVFAKESR